MEPHARLTLSEGGKRYSTVTAALLAGDDYYDGRSCLRNGRNTYLYRTGRGDYFLARRSQWVGETDRIEPISREEAMRAWESELAEHRVGFSEAFPDSHIA